MTTTILELTDIAYTLQKLSQKTVYVSFTAAYYEHYSDIDPNKLKCEYRIAFVPGFSEDCTDFISNDLAYIVERANHRIEYPTKYKKHWGTL